MTKTLKTKGKQGDECPLFEHVEKNGKDKGAGGKPSSLVNSRKLTVKEGAKVMGISPNSLRTVIKNGEIQVLEVGKKVMLLEQDIEKYLAGHYGRMKEAPASTNMPALPREIAESPYLKEAG